MANTLKREKQIYVIGSLAEGTRIKSIERLAGVHHDTIMRLGVRVGKGCAYILDSIIRNLKFKHLKLNEIWGFVAKKQRNIQIDEQDVADIWTFVAIVLSQRLFRLL